MRPSLRQVLFRSVGLDLNFAGGVFSLTNTRTDTPAAIPGWSFSRTDTNGTATALDLAGNVIQFPSRTNLILQSQTFDNGSWTKTETTVTADATAAPDESVTADKIVESTANAAHHVLQAVSIAASATYTTSVFLKAGERDTAFLWLANSATADRAQADIALTGAGSITVATAGGSAFTGASGTITALTNGWYRVTLTATTTGGAISLQTRLYVRQLAAYTGTAGWGLFAWGAQLETGSTATAYIPTTTAAVTVVLPRITNRGILVEEARTNLALNSAWAGVAAGAPTSWTVLLNGGGTAATSTIGAPNAMTFTASATRPSIFQDVAVAANTTYTASLFVEANPDGLDAFQIISLTGAPAGSTVTGTTGVPVAGQRVTATVAVGGTSGTVTIRAGVGTSSTSTGTVRLSLPQIELGAFATSPIITTGAAGTRGADDAFVSGLTINSATMTLAAEAEFLLQTTNADTALGTVTDTASAGQSLLAAWRATNGDAFFQTRTAGLGTAVSYGSTAKSGARILRMATALNGTAATGAIDGTLVTPATIATPPGLTRLNIGTGFSVARPANTYIRRIRILPTALPDAQLQALTAP